VVTNIHVDRFRASVFAASVVNPLLDGISHHQEGNNLYGAYGWIARVLPKSSIEPFVLWRVAPSVAVEDSKLKTGHLDEKAGGFRIRGTGLRNFDYRYELVLERGSAGSNGLQAWGTTGGAGYTVPTYWKPRFFTGYDYASGDKNPTDGTHGTFDTMYPTAHDRFGIADQFGWQNIVAWRGGATINPHRRLSVTGQYLDFWLASAKDAAYNSSGGVIFRDPTGKSGTHIGQELDAYAWYEINREVHIGAGIGHILPGEFIDKVGKGAAYTYPYFVIEMFDGKRVR
jgi:Alginate export